LAVAAAAAAAGRPIVAVATVDRSAAGIGRNREPDWVDSEYVVAS